MSFCSCCLESFLSALPAARLVDVEREDWERVGHQQRLIRAFTKNVFIFSLLKVSALELSGWCTLQIHLLTRVTDGRTDIHTDGRLYDPENRIAYTMQSDKQQCKKPVKSSRLGKFWIVINARWMQTAVYMHMMNETLISIENKRVRKGDIIQRHVEKLRKKDWSDNSWKFYKWIFGHKSPSQFNTSSGGLHLGLLSWRRCELALSS